MKSFIEPYKGYVIRKMFDQGRRKIFVAIPTEAKSAVVFVEKGTRETLKFREEKAIAHIKTVIDQI
jgi:hypothetical protein